MIKKSPFAVTVALTAVLLVFQSCKEKEEHYTFKDFKNVKKTDVHLHINSTNRKYMELAAENNFRVISPNVDSHFPVEEQLDTAAAIKRIWPGKFAFFGTFSVDSFGTKNFSSATIERIKKCMSEGACGIKIWKNIGMVLRDADGRYVMVDDPAFNEIFTYMEQNKIPVMGHLGEPKNCWLPLEQMTDTGNYRYYKSNPQYHMFLHPEAPSYDDQINARDNLLKLHPALDFTGAHFASLEWSIDEIAKRLDSFPNMKIDMSARVAHLQYQSIADWEHVREFMIKYQDRILYGTDITVNPSEADPDSRIRSILDRWTSNWIYFATDSTVTIKNIKGEVKGLNLPKSVIDKIYNSNADKFFRDQE